MKLGIVLAAAGCLFSSVPAVMGQTVEQFFAVYNLTRFHLERDPALARKLVRFAFHDAMGGVDAHIDLTNEEHRGMNRTFKLLERMYNFSQTNDTSYLHGGMRNESMWMHGGPGGMRNESGRFGMRGNRDGGNRGGNGGGRQGGVGPPGMRNRNETQMYMRERPALLSVSLEGLSKADFFAWTYISAFYYSCGKHVPWVPLLYGRTTNLEAQPEEVPPNSEFGAGDREATMAYFQEHFDFSESQVAVLLGAHTLGGANRRNTGFEGQWTRSENMMNNEYYENMIFPPGRGGWEQIKVESNYSTTPRYQWRWGCNNRCRDLMLNVDVQLFYDLDNYFVGDYGEVRVPEVLPASAPVELCQNTTRVFLECFPKREESASYMTVSLMENGNTELFLDNFALVFGDMISRIKDGSTLEFLARPADWPAGIVTGHKRRHGRGRHGGRGRGGRGGRPGHGGRPGDGDGPFGCPGFEDVVVDMDGEFGDMDFDEEDEFFDEEDEGEVFEAGATVATVGRSGEQAQSRGGWRQLLSE